MDASSSIKQETSWAQDLVSLFSKRDQLYKQAIPRVDQSLAKLESFAQQGYAEVEWDAGFAQCFSCRDLSGQAWPINEFIMLTHHEAPMFSKTHVNCGCRLILRGPNLPDAEVDSY